MTKLSETTKTSETSLTQDLLSLLRYWLGGRKGMIALIVLAVVAGAILNWGWLVALGIAPLILALLPCAAMCALGLCMNKMMGSSCATQQGASKDMTASRTDQSETLSQVAVDTAQPGLSEGNRQVPPEPPVATVMVAEVNPTQTMKEKENTHA